MDEKIHKALNDLRRCFRIYGWVERESDILRGYNTRWDIIAQRLSSKAFPILHDALIHAVREEERIRLGAVCLNCGRTEPCELDKPETAGVEDWPGSPCTFEYTPHILFDAMTRYRIERDELQERLDKVLSEQKDTESSGIHY